MKIDVETGKTTSNAGGSRDDGKPSHPYKTMVSLNPALITCALKLSFVHVTQFAGL